ncbi:hypothetical protein AMTR_s00074p00154530 [Amborella trichopoda]|uniref:Uncharacterized protein n=1 Tax=Amborella trichopoda TaxID=13333 RepID=W1NPL3_AMBTC|nr:hypothetical protein AMTR_s00074p00154530 [Amborella trichopoda]
MDLTLGFGASNFGNSYSENPTLHGCVHPSTFAFSGSLNLLRNLPWLLSTLCHLSIFSSISFLAPLIHSTSPSSNSTLTSSFLSPGRSALNTWALSVSFQLNIAFEKAEAAESLGLKSEKEEMVFVLKGEGKKPSKGSQMSREKGS